MIILKGAIKITLEKVYETILTISLFRFTYYYVKFILDLIFGIGGLYAFFLTIYVNNKIRKFIITKYEFYKKKFFPKYVDPFVFDGKHLEAHDLKTIFSTAPPPEVPIGAIGMVPSLTKDDCKVLRNEFTNLKNNMEENLFSFIFDSATRSSLINILTLMFVEYLKNTYEINIFLSLTICISTAFLISFFSTLKYTKIISKEWQEIIEDIEDMKNNKRKNNNSKYMLYVYNTEQPIITLDENDNIKVEEKKTEVKKPEEKNVRQRKGKKSKQDDKNDLTTAETDEKNEKKEEKKSKYILVGVFNNNIENEEHLKVKLMLINRKFKLNIHVLTENFFSKYLPHVLLTLPGQAPVVPGANQMKSALNNLSNLMQNFFLLTSAQITTAITKDTFFSSRSLKNCTFFVTDYYDIEGNLSKYFRGKNFKLEEKWVEFVMFMFIKFKVYEFKKDFASIPNKNPNQTPAAPSTLSPPPLTLLPPPAQPVQPTFNLFNSLQNLGQTNPNTNNTAALIAALMNQNQQQQQQQNPIVQPTPPPAN